MPAFRSQTAPEPPASASEPNNQTDSEFNHQTTSFRSRKMPAARQDGFRSILVRPGEILALFYRLFFACLLCMFFLQFLSGFVSYGGGASSVTEITSSDDGFYEESYTDVPTSEVVSLSQPGIAGNSKGDLFVSAEVSKSNVSKDFSGGSVNVELSRNGDIFWSEEVWIPWMHADQVSYPFSLVVSHDFLPEGSSGWDLSDVHASINFVDEYTPDLTSDVRPDDSFKAKIIENGIASQSGVVVYSLSSDSSEWPAGYIMPVIAFYKDGSLVYAATDEVDMYDERFLSPEGMTCSFIADTPLPAYDDVKIIPFMAWE